MANIQHHKLTVYGKEQTIENLKNYCNGKNEAFDVSKMTTDLPELYKNMVDKNGGYYSFNSSFDVINSGKAEIWFDTKWAVASPYITMLSVRFPSLLFVLEAQDDILNSSIILVLNKGLTLVEANLEKDVLMARGLSKEEAEKVIEDEKK